MWLIIIAVTCRPMNKISTTWFFFNFFANFTAILGYGWKYLGFSQEWVISTFFGYNIISRSTDFKWIYIHIRYPVAKKDILWSKNILDPDPFADISTYPVFQMDIYQYHISNIWIYVYPGYISSGYISYPLLILPEIMWYLNCKCGTANVVSQLQMWNYKCITAIVSSSICGSCIWGKLRMCELKMRSTAGVANC